MITTSHPAPLQISVRKVGMNNFDWEHKSNVLTQLPSKLAIELANMSNRSLKTIGRRFRSANRTFRRTLKLGPKKITNNYVGTKENNERKLQRFKQLYKEYENDTNPSVHKLMNTLYSDTITFDLLPNKPANSYIHQADIYTFLKRLRQDRLEAEEYLLQIPNNPAYYNTLKTEMTYFIPFFYTWYTQILTERLHDIVGLEEGYKRGPKLTKKRNVKKAEYSNTSNSNSSNNERYFTNYTSTEPNKENYQFTNNNTNTNTNSNKTRELSIENLDPNAYRRLPNNWEANYERRKTNKTKRRR